MKDEYKSNDLQVENIPNPCPTVQRPVSCSAILNYPQVVILNQ